MFKVKVMNSTGASKDKILEGDTPIIDIINDPELSGLLNGTQFSLNGESLVPTEYHKTLGEMGADPERTNYFAVSKAANGNC